MKSAERSHIVDELQAEILRLQGYKPFQNPAVDMRMGPISHAFPNGSFPIGAVHEFLCTSREQVSTSSGFITGLLSPLMSSSGTAMWISTCRTIFPPALKSFGVQPDRVIFIDLKKESDVLWALEEGLKCAALTAVVGELQDLTFNASRRLQLAVERSQATGFILRNTPKKINTTACVSRWKISPLPSQPVDNLPGLGFPKWRVELLRIRNGKTGSWDIQFMNGRFETVFPEQVSQDYPSGISFDQRKAG
jgi:protein ImuA